jgi:putative transposase
VPKNLKRYYGSSDPHFITCSRYHRQPLLGTPHLRDLFLKALEQMRTRYRFVVLGYVVMPEHFHLLISEPHQGIHSTVMQAIKLGFARRVLGSGGAPCLAGFARCGDSNRIWERRFYDFNVWTERKRIEKLRYMHRNPVKRGLVQEPDQWPWSSFRSYA